MTDLSYKLSSDLARAVAADGLPRLAEDENGSGTLHVLYLEDDLVHSKLLSAWGDAPKEPTPAEIDAAMQARAENHLRRAQESLALRQRVRDLAQSAVGVRIDLLSAPQVRALQAVLLWQAGALDKDGVVQPLAEWVR